MNCRLIYLVGQLGLGGYERQLHYLLQTMDRERYKPAVIVSNFCEEDVYVPNIRALGVPVYSLSNSSSAVTKLAVLRNLIKQLRPEVIHSYSFYTNFAAYWAVRNTPTVPVGSLRSDMIWDKRRVGLLLGSLSARWPRHQISNNFSAEKQVGRFRSFFVPRQVYVVPNGLDLHWFRNTPFIDYEKTHILGVGSLLPVKRWDRLLEAVLKLKSAGYDCLLKIAGEGPLRGALEHQTRDLGLTDRVMFMGQVDDISNLFSKTTFLVHTSDIEGCPNVVMEAMACGRPVVATNAGDVPFLVEDGKTGFVVRRGDTNMLADRMMRLIADRHLCKRMGESGRAKAQREFGTDLLVSRTLDAYKAAGWKD